MPRTFFFATFFRIGLSECVKREGGEPCVQRLAILGKGRGRPALFRASRNHQRLGELADVFHG